MRARYRARNRYSTAAANFPPLPQRGLYRLEYAAAATLASGGPSAVTVDAPGARAAPVRVSVGARVPPPGPDPRGTPRPVFGGSGSSSQSVSSFRPRLGLGREEFV